MTFNGSQTRNWNRNTPADGELIQPEIVRIYQNLNHLKDGQDNPVVNFLQLNDAPSSYSGKKGMLPVVNSTEDGLDFVDHFGLLDYKWSGRKFSPSPLEPWFRADQDQTFLDSNWPLLVPLLRNTKYEIGSASIFNVTGFSSGSVTRLQLEDTVTARNLLRTLLEDYQFSKSYTASTNADGSDSDSEFSSWGMIVRIASDIGTNTNAPKVGQEFRVKYLTSLANTLSVTNRYICIEKDTSSLATTGTGTIEIYPFRIASEGTPTTTSAKWRKISEAGLMTPGSVFYSGTDLVEVPANARVRDRFQSFVIQPDGNPITGGSNIPTSGGSYGLLSVSPLSPSSTGTDGTLRPGPNTRQRSGVAYLYGCGKIYV